MTAHKVGDERRVACLSAQNRVLRIVAKGGSAAKALREVAGSLERLCPRLHCIVGVLAPRSETFAEVLAPQVPTELQKVIMGFPLRQRKTPCAIAALRREPVIVNDLAADGDFREIADVFRSLGYCSYWSHPILDASGQAVGAISLLLQAPDAANASVHGLVDDFLPIARLAIEHDRRARALDSADIRFSALAESIPGVVYQRVVTPDGNVYYTYISEGAREFFGVSPAEILADPKALFDCHAPEYRETFHQSILEASRNLEMWDVEAPIIARDGTRKWSHAIARPNRREDGSVVWNGIILDSTRIKEANIELAALNRAKSEFLANISHELRTPLNAIIGFSEVLTRSLYGPLGDPHYDDYARDIYQSGSHLLSLINDILDITRIEVGKLELHEGEIDIVKTVEACIRIVNGRAREKDIRIELIKPTSDCSLYGDERKLKQSLINLLSNAIKFSARGSHVGVRIALDNERQISVSVADEGIGIPEAQRESIFEPFVQVETGLDRPHDGAGLGLPLTKSIVDLHGGSLELSGREGEGSVFTMIFPAERTRLVGTKGAKRASA